jgi:hypothetical protein
MQSRGNTFLFHFPFLFRSLSFLFRLCFYLGNLAF